jgi:multiple sugar transport system ATP-binding protein
MTDIELRNITLDLPDGTRVLDDVSLDVPSGTNLAICGPARAGKTTILRILAGLADATDGEVLLDGVVSNRVSPRDRNLSMVFSDYLLHPHLDTYDNMAFAALLRRIQPEDEIDALVEEVADLLALTSVLDDRPAKLDQAQRQRTAVGRSLVRDAAGYLFDEAFAAQEPRIRGHVRSVTVQWQADLDRTSIFTTSHPEEAITLADQVAVLNLGWVHQVGSPRDIYDKPADLFVAGFMGAPAMNLVPATVEGRTLHLPFADVPMDLAMAEKVGEREVVVVGIRPEHCFDASKPESYRLTRPVEIEARVDDVEWGGKTQSVYLGYEMDPEIEDQLTAIEDDFEFDLFHNFFVAQLASDTSAEVGSTVRLAVSADRLLLFDLETAERLRDPGEPEPVYRSAPVEEEELEDEDEFEDEPEDDGEGGLPVDEPTGPAAAPAVGSSASEGETTEIYDWMVDFDPENPDFDAPQADTKAD